MLSPAVLGMSLDSLDFLQEDEDVRALAVSEPGILSDLQPRGLSAADALNDLSASQV